MRPARHPAQYLLRHDDAKRKGFRGAVQRRENHEPTRLAQRRARLDEEVAILDMLDNFESEDDVPPCFFYSTLPQRLRGTQSQARSPLACARATSMACASASIPVTAAPKRASGSHTSPPPHPTSSTRKPAKGVSPWRSKCAQTRSTNISHAQRVQPVQGAERTVLFPPPGGILCEMGYFLRIKARCHGLLNGKTPAPPRSLSF